MIKKVVEYPDYEGRHVKETYCFNLSKVECMDLNFEYEEYGGLVGYLATLIQGIKNGDDSKRPMWDFLKKLIHRSVGRQSADGRRFEKSDAITNDFEQTNAFGEFIFGLLENPESISDFMAGVLPEAEPEAVERARSELAKQGLEISDLPTTQVMPSIGSRPRDPLT